MVGTGSENRWELRSTKSTDLERSLLTYWTAVVSPALGESRRYWSPCWMTSRNSLYFSTSLRASSISFSDHLANVFRDAQLDPLGAESVELLQGYREGMGKVVADGWNTGGERREALLAAIAIALDFQTWRTLVRGRGLDQDRAVELMVGMVRCLMRT